LASVLKKLIASTADDGVFSYGIVLLAGDGFHGVLRTMVARLAAGDPMPPRRARAIIQAVVKARDPEIIQEIQRVPLGRYGQDFDDVLNEARRQ
jgi:pyridoxal biosynthesis lyase PdxS